jgi:SAM-dependent methyltransferase
MGKKVERPGVRAGYDQWAHDYDQTPNPLVALDRRYTLKLLQPGTGERILDAGCGTGGNLRQLLRAGSEPLGVDFSRGMLSVARRNLGGVALAQADLNQGIPVRPRGFQAVLCALVGEHLQLRSRFFADVHQALLPGGRFVFSVFHPAMARAGLEANFERDGVQYRLGAHRHAVDDYLVAIAQAGFRRLQTHEFTGDEALARQIPAASKYLGQPLLLAVEARRAC